MNCVLNTKKIFFFFCTITYPKDNKWMKPRSMNKKIIIINLSNVKIVKDLLCLSCGYAYERMSCLIIIYFCASFFISFYMMHGTRQNMDAYTFARTHTHTRCMCELSVIYIQIKEEDDLRVLFVCFNCFLSFSNYLLLVFSMFTE